MIIKNCIINQCNGCSIVRDGKEAKVIINDKIYDAPTKKCSSVTVINNKPFIDGYELVNGKWKRTLRALWHLLF